jgi:hypothetical protein
MCPYLKDSYDKAIAALLKDIDKFWDDSNPSAVIPAKDHGNSLLSIGFDIRNDSIAAASIIKAKMVLKELGEQE